MLLQDSKLSSKVSEETTSQHWPPKRLREPAVMAWLRLMRVDRQVMRAAFCPLRDAGLTTSQFSVIAKVGTTEGIAQQDLASWLSVTEGNASQLLAKTQTCQQISNGKYSFDEGGAATVPVLLSAHRPAIATRSRADPRTDG